jgi:hypothetical protein
VRHSAPLEKPNAPVSDICRINKHLITWPDYFAGTMSPEEAALFETFLSTQGIDPNDPQAEDKVIKMVYQAYENLSIVSPG